MQNMLKHGINTYKDSDSSGIIGVKTAAVGIPFFIGAWPCHQVDGAVNKPILVNN